MTRSARRPFVPASAAAALAIATIAAATQGAEAAQSRSAFQQSANLDCGGGTCRADFIDLPANQALDVGHVWCEMFTAGTIAQVRVYAAPVDPYFTIPLSVRWLRTVGSKRGYTFGDEIDMRVPLGKTFTAVVDYDGADPIGSCSFTGERIINS